MLGVFQITAWPRRFFIPTPVESLTNLKPAFLLSALTLSEPGGALCFQIDFTRTFRHSKNFQNPLKPPLSLPPYPQWWFRMGGGQIKGQIGLIKGQNEPNLHVIELVSLANFENKKNLFLLRTSKGNTGNVKTGYQIQDFLKLDWILTTPGYPRLPQDL